MENIPQIKYSFTPQEEGLLRIWLEKYFPEYKYRSRKDQLTIQSGATSFGVSSNYMVLTGATGVTIATIYGGYEGQILTLEFTDTNITITDDATKAKDTVNLSAAFTSSAEDTLQLIYDGTSWREVSRSIN